MTLLGHFKNGVIVLDTPVNLKEGTPVRVETLVSDEQARRADRYRLLLQRLDEGNKEDAADGGRLGDLLQQELAAERGLPLGDDGEIEKILSEP